MSTLEVLTIDTLASPTVTFAPPMTKKSAISVSSTRASSPGVSSTSSFDGSHSPWKRVVQKLAAIAHLQTRTQASLNSAKQHGRNHPHTGVNSPLAPAFCTGDSVMYIGEERWSSGLLMKKTRGGTVTAVEGEIIVARFPVFGTMQFRHCELSKEVRQTPAIVMRVPGLRSTTKVSCDASQRSPQCASQRSPGDASQRSPGDASQRSPGNASQRSLVDASQRSPGDGSQWCIGDASQRRASDASQRSPGGSQRNPSDALQQWRSDALQWSCVDGSQWTAPPPSSNHSSQRSPVDASQQSRSPSDGLQRYTGDASQRNPCDALQHGPSDIDASKWCTGNASLENGSVAEILARVEALERRNAVLEAKLGEIRMYADYMLNSKSSSGRSPIESSQPSPLGATQQSLIVNQTATSYVSPFHQVAYQSIMSTPGSWSNESCPPAR